MNKYIYLYVLQGRYFGKFEDLTASESLNEVKADLKAYRENENSEYRIIKRRVKNEKYIH